MRDSPFCGESLRLVSYYEIEELVPVDGDLFSPSAGST
jgi:hypothetical protein